MPAIVEEHEKKDEKKKQVVRRKPTSDKRKTKKWFEIIAPGAFNNVTLAWSPAVEEEQVINRVIHVNGMEFGSRKNPAELLFRVDKVQGLKAGTRLYGFEISPGYLKRMVKRRSTKVEHTQRVQTQDNHTIKVKTLVVAAIKLDRAKETGVRKIVEDQVRMVAGNVTAEGFINDLAFGSVPQRVLGALKNIGNVRRVEFVAAKIES